MSSIRFFFSFLVLAVGLPVTSCQRPLSTSRDIQVGANDLNASTGTSSTRKGQFTVNLDAQQSVTFTYELRQLGNSQVSFETKTAVANAAALAAGVKASPDAPVTLKVNSESYQCVDQQGCQEYSSSQYDLLVLPSSVRVLRYGKFSNIVDADSQSVVSTSTSQSPNTSVNVTRGTDPAAGNSADGISTQTNNSGVAACAMFDRTVSPVVILSCSDNVSDDVCWQCAARGMTYGVDCYAPQSDQTHFVKNFKGYTCEQVRSWK